MENKHLIAEAIEVVNEYRRAIKRKNHLIKELEKLTVEQIKQLNITGENFLQLLSQLKRIK